MISFFANIGKFQNPAYASFAYLENPMTVAVVEDGEISVPENLLEKGGAESAG